MRFEPQPATLDLWFIDLAREPSEDEWALLSEDERERALRLIVPSKRRQSIRARAALRHVLAGYLPGADPGELRFEYGEHGKPTLVQVGAPTFSRRPKESEPEGPAASAAAGAAERQPLVFNLSHSHELGLLGVVVGDPDLRLGVDIEHARPGRAFEAIAEHFFTDEEAAWLESLGPERCASGFYRMWTHKEAYLKALGTGLSFSSRGFSLAVDADPGTLRSTSWPGDRPSHWRFAALPCSPDYAAAACWTGEPLGFRRFVAPGTELDRLDHR